MRQPKSIPYGRILCMGEGNLLVRAPSFVLKILFTSLNIIDTWRLYIKFPPHKIARYTFFWSCPTSVLKILLPPCWTKYKNIPEICIGLAWMMLLVKYKGRG